MLKWIGAVSALMVVGAAHAVILDDFTTGAFAGEVVDPGVTVQNTQSGANIVGTFRDLEFEAVSNPLRSFLRVEIGNGLNVVDAGSQLTARVRLAYDGNDTGLNLDLSSDAQILLNFKSNDRALRTVVTLGTFGGNSTVLERVVAGGRQNTNFTEAFDFSGSVGGVDLADVDSVQIDFFTSPSGDFALGSIEAVPEPATMAALAAGIGAVLARRRRKNA